MHIIRKVWKVLKRTGRKKPSIHWFVEKPLTNFLTFAKALQMAVKQTGYLPYEIVTDKFPRHNTPNKILTECLGSLGVKHI